VKQAILFLHSKLKNKKQKKKALETKFPRHGALKGTRTPDLLVRRGGIDIIIKLCYNFSLVIINE